MTYVKSVPESWYVHYIRERIVRRNLESDGPFYKIKQTTMSNVRNTTPSPSTLPSSATTQKQDQKQQRQLTHEQRLTKGWSNMRYTVVSAFERAQAAATAAEQKDQPTFQSQSKELDKSLVHFLKYRIDWHRLISQVEAKLQGKAQEREALETYVRTQPKLGKRKREATLDSTLQTPSPAKKNSKS